jgi:hypothetical protein
MNLKFLLTALLLAPLAALHAAEPAQVDCNVKSENVDPVALEQQVLLRRQRDHQGRRSLVALLLDAVVADWPAQLGDADADAQRSTASSPCQLNNPA